MDLAGRYSDESGGNVPCEYFFEMLNALESAEFDSDLEWVQRGDVMTKLADARQEALTTVGLVVGTRKQ